MSRPLREKLEEWQEWLLGEDVHSIRKQIHSMIWDSAVFQSVNESRRYAPRDEEGKPELNGVVHQFINRCFFDTQATAIRRLLDKKVASGKYSVISLFRLLDDMEKHAHLLTRESVLKAFDLPYDYIGRREELDRTWDGSFRVCGQDHKDCERTKHVHKNMDFLTRTDSSQREPSDTVPKTVLQWLIVRLKKCEAVSTFVNKFLAHSATRESRATIANDQTDITLGQILDAHKTICQIAEFVSRNFFLRSIGNPLPVCQGNQFEHFEKPWATEETLAKLHGWWRDYSEITDQWRTWDWQAELPTCS